TFDAQRRPDQRIHEQANWHAGVVLPLWRPAAMWSTEVLSMSVVVTPRGTRGVEWPRLPRPLMSAFFALFHLAYRAFGDRMRVQGRPLLELETVGAKSGVRRHAVLGWFPEAFAEPEAKARETIGSRLV